MRRKNNVIISGKKKMILANIVLLALLLVYFIFNQPVDITVEGFEQGPAEVDKIVEWEGTVTSEKILPKKITNLKVTDKDGNEIEYDIEETDNGSILIVEEEAEVTFETEAPTKDEEKISGHSKKVIISSDTHYEDIAVETDLPIEAPEEKILLYFLNNGKKKEYEGNIDYVDTNNNGLIDKIKWIVPHLSTQEYIIEINVLDVYSYLKDGDEWIIRFETVGTEDLKIYPTNAQYGNELEFIELRCGNEVYENAFTGTSIEVNDWECNTIAIVNNLVNIAGYATLKFEFGDAEAYAYDPVNITGIILNATSVNNLTTDNLTLYITTNDTNSKNITNWYVNGNSITVLNMPFENNGSDAGTKDYSGYGNDGTENGGVTWNSTGGYDGKGAYDFDGNDYIDLGTPSTLAGLQVPLTITGWFNQSSATGYQPVYAAYTWTDTHRLWSMIRIDTGTFAYYTSTAAGGFQSAGTFTPSVNDWHFFAITISGNLSSPELTIYLDDSNESISLAALSSTPDLTVPVYIGGSAYGEGFIGTIDEINVFNRSLTAAQISAIHKNQTNLIHAEETSNGDIWRADVTPNDGTEDGITRQSNNITIRTTENTLPNITSISLNATSVENLTTDDLTLHLTTEDIDGDNVKNITNWYKDETSITVLNMPFENNGSDAGTKDYSGYGNNGTESGAVWDATGGYDGNGAYTFSGSGQYIDVGANPILTVSPPFSFETWFNHADTSPDYILVRGNVFSAGNVAYEWGLDNGGGGNGVSLQWYGSCFQNSPTTFTITTNEWHHLVSTFDGTYIRHYYDGVLKYTSGAVSCQPPPKITNTRIGSLTRTGGYDFNGKLDEVRIYNRTLSPEQIQILYNNKTDIIVSEETSNGDIWRADVTPNDGTEDGITRQSNNITIRTTENTLPNITSISLNATSVENLTTDDLTLHLTTEDTDGDNVKNITNWYKDGKSITVLNMPFENNGSDAGTKDYSGYGNDGTENGGVTWNATGGYDGRGAYECDGSATNYVSIPDSDLWTMNRDFTIEFWTKFNSLAGNWWERIWIAHDNGGGSVNKWMFGYDGTKSDLHLNGPTSGSQNIQGNAWTPTIGKWYHIALTRNGNTYTFYRDGQPDGTAVNSATWGNSAVPLTICFSEGSATLNGVVDDIKIWNKTLSEAQINAIYENKTNLIVSEETDGNEVWYAKVTPNDGIEDGITRQSNNITIIGNTLPNITSIILNATSIENLTTDNLTLHLTTEDTNGDSVKNITNWYVDGTSITALNMPFENNGLDAGTTDYSGYGNNGTVGGANWNATGGYDGRGAYEFGQTNYLDIGTDSSLDLGSTFTVEARVKIDTLVNYAGVVSKDSARNYPYSWMFVVHNDGTIGAYDGGTWRFSDAAGITTDTWYHLMWVVDGGNVYYYVDGQSKGSDPFPYSDDPNDRVYIGSWYGLNTAQDLIGTIDEVKIYNKLLTTTQIQALYNNITDIMVSEETDYNEVWHAKVTPNDGFEDGITRQSNSLTIYSEYPPGIGFCDFGNFSSTCLINTAKNVYSANSTWNLNNLILESSGSITIVDGDATNLTIIGENITIDGSIDGIGAGYQRLAASTYGGLTGSHGGGGNYGGKGGGNSKDTAGSVLIPDMIGAEGGEGNYWTGQAAGDGGGLVTIVGDNVNISGLIIVDGTSGVTAYGRSGGGGSGGGIYINSTSFTGNGNLTARGANGIGGGNPGGGGRIAVHYDTNTFTGSLNASTGTGNNQAYYGEGTALLYEKDTNNIIIPSGSLFRIKLLDKNLTNNFTFNNFTLESSAILDVNKQTDEDATEYALQIIDTFTLENRALITTTKRGYLRGEASDYIAAWGAGDGPGGTNGGKGGGNLNSTKGSAFIPNTIGSEGTDGNYQGYVPAGDGAGLIYIYAGTANISGNIEADGTASTSSLYGREGGGGAGGSIFINVTEFIGNGTISAQGGAQLNDGHAGGGGRIAVHYDTSTFTGQFDASAGTGNNQAYYGEGTVVLYDKDDNSIIIPSNNLFRIKTIDKNITNNFTFNNFTIESSATLDVNKQTNENALETALWINDTFTLEENALITMTDRGYQRGEGSPFSGVYGPGDGDGGTNGGMGGGNVVIPNGSIIIPDTVGSEGTDGNYQGPVVAGDGAGLIHIHAGTANISGNIEAEGIASGVSTYGREGGAGAGGSLLINATEFVGNGTISLKGGDNVGDGQGGGGGKFAAHYVINLYTGTIDVSGGLYNAGVGTIFLCERLENSTCESYNGITLNSVVNQPYSTNLNRTIAEEWNITRIIWNDTGTRGMDYAISGLKPNTPFAIYDNSGLVDTTYANVNGDIQTFDITLASEHEILLNAELVNATYNTYNGITTDFNNQGNLSNITNPKLEDTTAGLIEWNNNIDANGADFDDYVYMGPKYLFLDTNRFSSSLNTPANITLYNADCNLDKGLFYSETSTDRDTILAEKTLCPANICTNKNCANGNYTFQSAHFSGYAIGENANLTITDDGPNNYSVLLNFKAYYLDVTNGNLITGATCKIKFSDNWGTEYNMLQDLNNYIWQKSFATEGTYQYNVTCTKAGYTPLTANDEVEISIGPAGTSNMNIFTEIDLGYPKGIDEQTYFYANYTNSTEEPIIGATCQIQFNEGMWGSFYDMEYNAPYYRYNKSFTTPGTKEYNITCSKTRYQTKSDDSTFAITSIDLQIENNNISLSEAANLYVYPATSNCTFYIQKPSGYNETVIGSLAENNCTGIYTNTTLIGEYEVNATVDGLTTDTEQFNVSGTSIIITQEISKINPEVEENVTINGVVTTSIGQNVSLTEIGIYINGTKYYYNMTSGLLCTDPTCTPPITDENGNYNYTFQAPEIYSVVDIIVNSSVTYEEETTITGENIGQIIIVNNESTEPTITNPIITPGNPNILSTLSCSATPTDNEHSSMFVNFTWYKNEVHQTPYDQLTVCENTTSCLAKQIPSSVLIAYDNWTCQAQSWDGSNYSQAKNATKEIDKIYPIVILNVSTNWPTLNEEIEVYGNVTNNDGTPLTDYDITIFLNGIQQYNDTTTGLLNTTGSATKTDATGKFNYTYKASDYNAYNLTVRAIFVETDEDIEYIITQAFPNTAPTISSTSITPTNPLTTNNLQCKTTPTDNQHESMLIYFRWFKNSTLEETQTKICDNNTECISKTIESSRTTKGENWTCEAKAFDGTIYSNAINKSVNISNTPATIDTIPDQYWVINRNHTLNLTSYTTDDDEDTISYSYGLTLNISITVNQTTGIALMEPETDFIGNNSIIFTADDGENTTDSNNFTLFVVECLVHSDCEDGNDTNVDYCQLNNYTCDHNNQAPTTIANVSTTNVRDGAWWVIDLDDIFDDREHDENLTFNCSNENIGIDTNTGEAYYYFSRKDNTVGNWSYSENFTTINASKIKITFDEVWEEFIEIREIQVYNTTGEDIAINPSRTGYPKGRASSLWDTSELENLNDGNWSTLWKGTGGTFNWIIIDFGTIKPINNITFQLYQQRTDKYTIEYYNGSEWKNLLTTDIPINDFTELQNITCNATDPIDNTIAATTNQFNLTLIECTQNDQCANYDSISNPLCKNNICVYEDALNQPSDDTTTLALVRDSLRVSNPYPFYGEIINVTFNVTNIGTKEPSTINTAIYINNLSNQKKSFTVTRFNGSKLLSDYFNSISTNWTTNFADDWVIENSSLKQYSYNDTYMINKLNQSNTIFKTRMRIISR